MDSLRVVGWVAFLLGFGWRILDEFAAKLLFRVAATLVSRFEKEKNAP